MDARTDAGKKGSEDSSCTRLDAMGFMGVPTCGARTARRREPMVLRVRTAQGIILLLHHSAQCRSSPCGHWDKCWLGKLMWKHVKHCQDENCKLALCAKCKMALAHFRYCQKEECPVCRPVRNLLRSSDCLRPKPVLRFNT